MRDSKNAIQFVRIAELLHNLSGGAFAQYANVRRISNPDNDIWHEILLSHMRARVYLLYSDLFKAIELSYV